MEERDGGKKATRGDEFKRELFITEKIKGEREVRTFQSIRLKNVF